MYRRDRQKPRKMLLLLGSLGLSIFVVMKVTYWIAGVDWNAHRQMADASKLPHLVLVDRNQTKVSQDGAASFREAMLTYLKNNKLGPPSVTCSNLQMVEGRRWVTLDSAQYEPGKNCYSSAVILYAKYRTGSTFMSRFLQQNKHFFYWFEPLNSLNRTLRLENYKQIMNGVLSCSATHISMLPLDEKRRDWMKHGMCSEKSVLIPGTRRYCDKDDFKPEMAQADCRRADRVSAKIIKLPSLSFLEDYLTAGARVIFHVRDPRGTLISRRNIENHELFQKEHKLTHLSFSDLEKYIVNEICEEMENDLNYLRYDLTASGLSSLVYISRYEDFARDPVVKLDDLYEFLKFPPDSSVRKFARRTVEGWGGKEKRYGTTRKDPVETSQAWRSQLSWIDVEMVQQRCAPVMQLLGYTIATNSKMLYNETISLVRPFDPNVARFFMT